MNQSVNNNGRCPYFFRILHWISMVEQENENTIVKSPVVVHTQTSPRSIRAIIVIVANSTSPLKDNKPWGVFWTRRHGPPDCIVEGLPGD